MNINSRQESLSFQKLIVKKKEILELGTETAETVIKSADKLKETAKENPNLDIYLQKGTFGDDPALEIMVTRGGAKGLFNKIMLNKTQRRIHYSATNRVQPKNMGQKALLETVDKTVAEFKKQIAETEKTKETMKTAKKVSKDIKKQLDKLF